MTGIPILDLFASANFILILQQNIPCSSRTGVPLYSSSQAVHNLHGMLVPRALVAAIISLLSHLCLMPSKPETAYFSPVTALLTLSSLNHSLGDTIMVWSIAVTKNQTMSKCQSHGLSGTRDS